MKNNINDNCHCEATVPELVEGCCRGNPEIAINRLPRRDAPRNDTIGDLKLKHQIGLNLFKTRAKADIPLDFVAKLTKIKIGKLDSLERGHGCMNVANLEKLAKFYDINIGDLFR